MSKQVKRAIKKSVDEVKDKVQAIEQAVSELRETGLNDKVIYTLIQKSSQKYTQLQNNSIKLDDVRAIVCGIERLSEYMFKKAKEEIND